MSSDIATWLDSQPSEVGAICAALHAHIQTSLPQAEGKVWHGAPVWFLNGNPVVGFASRKKGVQLLFWSGHSFETPGLTAEGKFMAAARHYRAVEEIDPEAVRTWLAEAVVRQWDYKNIVRRRGVLEKLGNW